MENILYFCGMKEPRKNKKNRYVVWVHVAPYVCRYLVDNFGVKDPDIKNLVDIRDDAQLMAFFSPRLAKVSHRYDRRKNGTPSRHYRTEKVGIEITASHFTRQGWALSPTDEDAMAKLLEKRCHGMLIAFLSGHYMLTGDLAASIRAFYRRFHQTEDTWPYDSIRKIWNRTYTPEQKISLRDSKVEQFVELFLVKLSEFGTISQKGKTIYEDY